MIEIDGKKVVLSEQVLLRDGENRVTFRTDEGLIVEVSFSGDGTGKPSLAPGITNNVFHLPLYNFGNPLGMAVSGTMSATIRGRPGSWYLAYTLCVYLVGEKFRLLTLTIPTSRKKASRKDRLS